MWEGPLNTPHPTTAAIEQLELPAPVPTHIIHKLAHFRDPITRRSKTMHAMMIGYRPKYKHTAFVWGKIILLW